MANISNPICQIQHFLQGAPHCRTRSYTRELCAGVDNRLPTHPPVHVKLPPTYRVYTKEWRAFECFVHGLEKTHRARCVLSKPCAKLTLHCNHRSGHLKTERTESLFLLRRHLGNWIRGPAVSMRSELLVEHEKLGQLSLLTVYVVPV